MTRFIAMAGGAPAEGQAAANPIVAFLPFILMFVIFYFLLIRPQQKKQKDHQKMVSELKKGDQVVTSGGVLGTIAAVKDDTVVLKMEDGESKMEILKSAVAYIRNQGQLQENK
ncbi:MAG: preprotein translocase subunit YajC [Candidatus Omnitrophica bacterium]|nr:preprotein translocase subunit YajC [Candidatus Omnitrophota bacterium]